MQNFFGIRVLHVMGVTDVDDKILKRALELNQSPQAVAEVNEVENLLFFFLSCFVVGFLFGSDAHCGSDVESHFDSSSRRRILSDVGERIEMNISCASLSLSLSLSLFLFFSSFFSFFFGRFPLLLDLLSCTFFTRFSSHVFSSKAFLLFSHTVSSLMSFCYSGSFWHAWIRSVCVRRQCARG